jgi:hypothetical protein
MGARNRVVIGLSRTPTRQCWNFRTIYGDSWVVVPYRNWFLGIDSWAPSKIKNPYSDMPLHATRTREDAAFSPGIFKQSMGARNRVRIGLLYRPASARILEQSMGARNRVGISLSYRPARLLYSLAELVPWNRFLGSLKV